MVVVDAPTIEYILTTTWRRLSIGPMMEIGPGNKDEKQKEKKIQQKLLCRINV